MGFEIEDGGNTSNTAKVDPKGRLSVKAVTEPEIENSSDTDGKAYSWASQTYDPAAGDTILLLKNPSDDDLHIENISLSADVDTRVVIHLPTVEVTPTGTAVTGTNVNTGRSTVAEATAIRDETDNSQGDVVWSGEIHAAQNPHLVGLMGALILAKNKSVGIDYVADVGACDVVIYGHFGD